MKAGKYMIKLTDLILPLEVIFPTPTFVVLKVTVSKVYVNGKKTDEIDGYRYELAEVNSFEKISVKIPSTKAIITQEVIDKAPKRISCTLEDCFAKPYRSTSGEILLSFRASSLKIATN